MRVLGWIQTVVVLGATPRSGVPPMVKLSLDYMYYFYHTTSWCGTRTADRIHLRTHIRELGSAERRTPSADWASDIFNPKRAS